MFRRPGVSTLFRSHARLFSLILILPVLTGEVSAQANATNGGQRIANFVDIAQKAGLAMKNVFGGVDTKKYIIETTGTGVAIFDYDNDGWPDIFFVNGTTLEDLKAGKSGPTNHLYHNNHDGTFTDVTEKEIGRASCRERVYVLV